MLLLESHDGSHLNPTQSRFSRFASGDTESSSAFGVTSRMFRNSSAAPALMPGYSDSSVQHALSMAGQSQEQASSQSQSHTSGSQMTVPAGHFSNQGGHYQEQDGHHAANSVSGSARSYAVHAAQAEMSQYSQQTSTHTSQKSTVMQTDGRTRLSSSERWQAPSSEQEKSPGASSRGYDDHDLSFLARSNFSRNFSHSPPQQAAGLSQDMQSHGELADPDTQYSWSAQSQSYASSASSPGRDSLHSWTGSTPARPTAPQDPASPDARTILRSIARECQNAVADRSPALGVNTSMLSPQSPSRPDLSRTPNTFFNPSFDADLKS